MAGFVASFGAYVSVASPSTLTTLWFAVLWACLVASFYVLMRQASATSKPANLGTTAVAASSVPTSPAEAQRIAEAQFLSASGHDLRQPLQAISLFSATLSAHPLPEASRGLVTGIEAAVETLSAQFEEVMSIAKVEAGRLSLDVEPVKLGAMLSSCVAAQMEMAHCKGLHLRHVNTRLRGMADASQLERVLDRLIEHALRVTEAGGVVVGCRARAERVVIEVYDSSSGIAPEVLQEVFAPFSQYGAQLPDRGLGLVLARRLAGVMGAELGVRSRAGRGNVFWLSLPRAGRSAA